MRKILCFIILLFIVSNAYGVDLSLAAGPWSFFSDDEAVPDGLYPYLGLNIGWGEYLESELFIVAQAAPDPFSTVFIGGALGSSILGTRGLTYFNMYAQLDFLYGLTFTETGIDHNRLAGLRVSPLVLGNGYNGYRDRLFTLGAFYNFDSGLFSFSWNVLIFDIFLIWP